MIRRKGPVSKVNINHSNRRPWRPSTRGFRARWRGSTVLIGALIAALAIAACGSSGGTPSGAKAAATTSTTANAQSAARQKFANCLKQHGVTLPSRPTGARPGTGTTGGQRFGNGNAGTGTGTTGAPQYPRGGTGGGYPGGGRFFGGGGNSKFAQAFKACAKYRPNFGNRPSGQFPQRFSAKVLSQFVTCVRKHGYPQMPAAKANGAGGFFPKSIQNNPKFKAAAAKCQSILQKALSQGRSRLPGGAGQGAGSSASTVSQA